MNFVDMFYVELREIIKVGLFIFFVLIAIVFIAACIYGLVDWINRKFFIHKFVFGKKGAGKERIDK